MTGYNLGMNATESSMNNTDTTTTDPRHVDFVATGQMLIWRNGSETMWSKLYKPSAEALGWDKPRTEGEKGEVLAIGSRFGGFSYVVLRVTGRQLSKATGTDTYATRCQVVMNLGPDSYPSDRNQVQAWITDKKEG